MGNTIAKGERFAEIGSKHENGNWAPHLHFQVMLSLFDFYNDFPGVIYPNQKDVWSGICPDPNLLFNVSSLTKKEVKKIDLIKLDRQRHL